MSKLLASISTFENLVKTIPDAQERLKPLYAYLTASEAKLLALLDAAGRGVEHAAPSEDMEGDLEFGLVLHWLERPDQKHIDVLLADPAMAIATQALVRFAPRSNIRPEIFTSFFNIAYNTGFVAADGTLYTTGKYAQLDALWLTAAANYTINLLDPDSIYHPFPANPYHAAIAPERQNITIAIIGDWGTGVYDKDYAGNGPAVAVMDAVRKMKPDYVVHLGDVYYCGTDERQPKHEEQTNLLDQWKTGTGAKTCFTLNSNHEMYGAAQGLIGVALTGTTPFAHQNSTTYFGLEFGDWVILGLDSAYFDSSMLYMKGALGNAANTQQRDFVKTTFGDLSGKKVFTMTHHNPMTFDGKSMTNNGNLWNGMLDTLGGKQPNVWYWGHLHLGVAYNDNSAIGKKSQTKTLGRCVGHSAIPFGNPSGMNPGNVDYYAHTNAGIGTKQVRNGFAIVTLGANGSLAEAFYEIDATGRCTQAWAKS